MLQHVDRWRCWQQACCTMHQMALLVVVTLQSTEVVMIPTGIPCNLWVYHVTLGVPCNLWAQSLVEILGVDIRVVEHEWSKAFTHTLLHVVHSHTLLHVEKALVCTEEDNDFMHEQQAYAQCEETHALISYCFGYYTIGFERAIELILQKPRFPSQFLPVSALLAKKELNQ